MGLELGSKFNSTIIGNEQQSLRSKDLKEKRKRPRTNSVCSIVMHTRAVGLSLTSYSSSIYAYPPLVVVACLSLRVARTSQNL